MSNGMMRMAWLTFMADLPKIDKNHRTEEEIGCPDLFISNIA